MEETTNRPALSRRSFLKTTGIVAGAALALGGLSACASTEEGSTSDSGTTRQKYATTCQGNCTGVNCPMDIFVEDGKVVDLQNFVGEDHPAYHAVCQRGYTDIERIYSPLRIKYPMRRTGEKCSGEFERISWDDAIDEICSKWKSYQEEYGDASVVFAVGSGSMTASLAQYDRLRAYMGATQYATSYDANGMNSVNDHIGYDPYNLYGNEFMNLWHSNKIFCWGANPSESATISYHFITEAQLNGCKLYVIDPVFTTTAGKADRYVSIRPGSDGLLAIGMMQIIIRDGNQDDEYLKAKTVAPFLVKASDGMYLRLSDLGQAEAGGEEDAILVCDEKGTTGTTLEIEDPVLEGTFEVNGIKVTTAYSLLLERLNEWSMDQIVELTTIPEETIEWLANEFIDGPTSILTGFGLDHWVNGVTGYRNMLTLLDIAGQMVVPGGGMTVIDISLPTAQGLATTAYSTPEDGKLCPYIPGAYFYEAVKDGSIGAFQQTIKSVFFYAHNPIGNNPERQKWLEIFEDVEFIVIADIWMSESCRHADLLLPVAYMWEKRDIPFSNCNPYFRFMEKAVEPQFEAKSDFDIGGLLGVGMGLGDKFTASIDDFLSSSIDNDYARAFGVTYERLIEEGRIWAYDEGHITGETMFYTATGRSQFYFEGTLPVFDVGLEWDQTYRALPYWFPPHEAWFENELYSKYPLIFMSERAKFKVHTMFTYVDSLLEIEPEPYVKMSRADADARGIETGDIIKLYNDRGYVVIKAVVNDGLREGVLVIDHGWQDDQFIEGHYSDLSSRYVDVGIPSPAWFDCLCEAEKVS